MCAKLREHGLLWLPQHREGIEMRYARGQQYATLAVAAGLAIAVAACGADDDSGGTPRPPATSATTDSPATPTTEPIASAVTTNAVDPNELSEPTRLTVQLQSSPAGSMAFLYAARADGLYEAAGIDLEILPGQSSQGTVEAVAQGNADIGLASGVALVLGAASGQELTTVGYFYGASTFGLFVPGDVDDPADMAAGLVGGEVLTIAGGPQNVLFDAFLSELGVEPADVTRTNVPIASLVQLYSAGEGDGLITVIPFAETVVQAERPSSAALFRDVTGIEPPDSAVIVHESLLERDPDVIERFLRVSYAALAGQREDPEGAISALLDDEPTLTEAIAIGQLLAQLEYLCPHGAEGETLGRTAPDVWGDTISLFQAAGLIGDLDPRSIHDDGFFDDASVSVAVC
jgi:NitT/TauT family transport system substrate-binding protein